VNFSSLCPPDKVTNLILQDLSNEYFRLQSVQEGWTQSLPKNYKKKYNFNSDLIQIFPTTTNRYEVLSNLQEDESVNVTTKDTKTQNVNNCPQTKGNIQLVRSVGKSEHKVLIFGDSHAKNVCWNFVINLIASMKSMVLLNEDL
jgi:hypothetical protein